MARADASSPAAEATGTWDGGTERLLDLVREYVTWDVAALGIVHTQKPRVDEVIALRDFPEPVLDQWLGGQVESMRLARIAMRQGVAAAAPDEAVEDDPLIRGRHQLVVMVPESIPQHRWWWMVLARRGEPFNSSTQQAALLALRQCQVHFHQADHSDVGRMIIGNDHRLILADLCAQGWILRHPLLMSQLLSQLHSLINQRYPHWPDADTRDAVLKLDGDPYWLSFRRERAIPPPRAQRLFLQLWRLEEEDLPAIAAVEDQRVALAIAYLHEHFARSPNLTELARAVHMSPFHFHRVFTRQVGISPKQYLQRKQLLAARWLLRRRGVPIGTIAQSTGFASHGHFTSTFHRLVGLSPTECRDGKPVGRGV